MTQLFGASPWKWVVGCLIMAVVWTVIWPKDRAAARPSIRFFLLRWGHALCWYLLAGAALSAWILRESAGNIIRGLVFLALASYFAFMAAYVLTPKR